MDTVNLGLLTRKCFEAVNDHVTAGVEYEQCTQYQPDKYNFKFKLLAACKQTWYKSLYDVCPNSHWSQYIKKHVNSRYIYIIVLQSHDHNHT